MTSTRSLAEVGVKSVECVVQCKTATTHSFTMMPLVSADGKLAPKLLIVLQEPGAKFPLKGHYMADNLVALPGYSHIMTKGHMVEWLRRVVFGPNSPLIRYLLVDSWPAFKDDAAFQSFVPAGRTFAKRNIPAGATSMVQPLDVFFFRPFKAMVKRITGYVRAMEVPFVVSQRDNILMLMSQVYWTFSAPRFQACLVYPWFKAGYLPTRPPRFQTPVEFCVPGYITADCQHPTCTGLSFIRCAYCEHFWCFDHFLVKMHRC